MQRLVRTMRFSDKLKQAMKELELNQIQVCGMTGKSKASISQYLSGKQVPSEKAQEEMATAMGLEAGYFYRLDEADRTRFLPSRDIRDGVIPKMDVMRAAELMQMNANTVRKGLQQGVFPWGYGIHTSDNRWVYFINARRFAEIEGIKAEEA